MKPLTESVLRHDLQPLCPRDDHPMHFEAKGISWKDHGSTEILPSYHCGFTGCSVRYDLLDGYFTVVHTPELPFFIEEPGVNVLRCPEHGTWLYRAESDRTDSRYVWRCGVDSCNYVHAQNVTGT